MLVTRLKGIGCLVVGLLMVTVPVAAQSPAADGDQSQAVAPAPPAETMDVFDLWRKLRHKDGDAQAETWDYRKPMMAFAPVIGAKPSSGVLLGAAGNIAFYRGDPSTTRISSMVASVTFSTKKQTSLTNRFTMFTPESRWRFDGDDRFQWTSLDTYGLGTSADTSVGIVADFDFFRLHHTAYYRLRPALYAGAGLYFDNHTSVGPDEGEEAAVDRVPVRDIQRSPRPSARLADLGWHEPRRPLGQSRQLHQRRSRMAGEGQLSDVVRRFPRRRFELAEAQPGRANLRECVARSPSSDRHLGFADLVVGGVAPFFDLPATAGDTYGRSARGYAEGQFRGERLVYGEIEYRGTLMQNGLLGMVAFLNTTTVTNLDSGEHLFDSFATGGGAGLRLLINKRSKTNLCFDVGFGKQGSQGVYLAIQEAF